MSNSLFKGIVKDKTNADIGWVQDKSIFYAEGYKMAVRELCKDYGQRCIREKDALLFPIVFSYRQYLELTLKGLIRKLLNFKVKSNRSDQELEKLLSSHRLLDLWDECSSLCENHIIANSSLSVFIASNGKSERDIIKNFNKVDPESFAFRYSADKKGKNNLVDIDYVSIANFSKQIEETISHLDNIIEMLSEH